MNTYIKVHPYVVILAIILMCTLSPLNAMKRSHEQSDMTEITQSEGAIDLNLLDLPTELWQKIFGSLACKANILLASKALHHLVNFKNWQSFVGTDTIARTLHLSTPARIRIYRLLLANTNQGDAQDLDYLLANDPDRKQHLAEITHFLQRPLSKLISNADMLAVLQKYEINIDETIRYAFSDHKPILASDYDIDSESDEDNPPYRQHIADLCDILLCNDLQRFDTFLENPYPETLFTRDIDSYDLDFFIKSDLIPLYCSVDTIKKLIPLLKQITCEALDSEEQVATADKYLLKRVLTQETLRLDIAEELLKAGTDPKYSFSSVVVSQNIKSLMLLSRYGLKLEQTRDVFDLLFHVDESSSTGSSPCTDFKDKVPNMILCRASALAYSVGEQKSPAFVKQLITIGAKLFNPITCFATQPIDMDRCPRDVLSLAKKLGNQEIVQVLQEARANNPLLIEAPADPLEVEARDLGYDEQILFEARANNLY